MTNFTIASEDAGAVVIQNRSGTVKIALDANQIRVVNGSTRIEIDNGSVIDAEKAKVLAKTVNLSHLSFWFPDIGDSDEEAEVTIYLVSIHSRDGEE